VLVHYTKNFILYEYKTDRGVCAYFAHTGLGPVCCMRYVDTSQYDGQSEGQQAFCRKNEEMVVRNCIRWPHE
jgi:hypothetical protein